MTEQLRNKVTKIHTRLLEVYGEPQWRVNTEPLGELINTVLSQNTNDRNRDKAYAQLRQRFPTWEEVRDAPAEDVLEAIRPAGLAPSKGPRIQSILQRITAERGTLGLEFLSTMPLEDARKWLLSLNGVGPKTAAIVLLFSLGRPAFPVDTHIHRVSKRLGLIPKRTSREKAHVLLEELVPSAHYYTFHINVIEHGRAICAARNPKCDRCTLNDLCDYYQEKQK
ncbi:MAG: endonuclease III [Anaerolineae bacterium]|nr:endonuclease III [Anaerolineae bacterium]